MKKQERKFFQRLKHKYRLIIYNDNTFAEVWYIRLSPLNVLALTGVLFIAFTAIFYLLIAYTSIREFIPGYPDAKMVHTIVTSSNRLDSLEKEIEKRDLYFNNLKNIISGKVTGNSDSASHKNELNKKVEFKRSIEDSLMRQQIENEEQGNLLVTDASKSKPSSLPSFHFFTPVKGLITNNYKPDEDHYGVDIVCAPNELVKAVLEGTVILSSWTLETGYIIEIQHDNNIISVYKHNSQLLKKVGNRVKVGEAIAIVGNSGELSTGPHLHFELWHEGKSVNPEDYIVF
jgi:murein DD-endopeptidase MepM/ murein hydrolase activator NlpD